MTDGTGSAGRIAKWLDVDTLGNSVIAESAGNVGIGITPTATSAKLVVLGTLNVTGSINTNTQYNVGGFRVLSIPGSNTFAGRAAGASNTSGTQNSFLGFGAGERNTTGSNNSFFGVAAGLDSTIGGQNSFFGSFAGASNTTGSLNSFFGNVAGSQNTIGEFNSFFGSGAGSANTEGSLNAFFGMQAGRLNTTGTGNTFIGQGAGDSNTTESSNTFIGANSGGAPGIVNAVAIGSGAMVTQNDSVVLGQPFSLVGIGISAPRAKLDVEGGNIVVGSAGFGIILKSPNGATCRQLRIDNAGNLVLAAVACP